MFAVIRAADGPGKAAAVRSIVLCVSARARRPTRDTRHHRHQSTPGHFMGEKKILFFTSANILKNFDEKKSLFKGLLNIEQ